VKDAMNASRPHRPPTFPLRAYGAAAAVALLLAATPCRGQQAELAAGIARARQVAASLKVGQQEAEAFASQLACADEAARSGQLFLSLHRMASPATLVGAFSFAAERASAAADEAAFEREWQRIGKELEAHAKPAGGTLPAAARAIAQAARHQTEPLYRSSLLYGQNTTLDNGLIYLGLARSETELAGFVEGLPFRETRRPANLAPVAREIAALEAKVVEAYGRAGADDRVKYPPINSALKLASELDRRGWVEGALYKYLEAAYTFGMLQAGDVEAGRADALAGEVASFVERFTKGPNDDSIGLLFAQIAQSALGPGCGADATTRAQRVAVVVDRVLPLYLEYASKGKP
jgi:hypothetical protein